MVDFLSQIYKGLFTKGFIILYSRIITFFETDLFLQRHLSLVFINKHWRVFVTILWQSEILIPY